MGSDRQVLAKLLVFRLLNALFIQTSFVPDEYWQSTEVAHYLVFGYGYLTWEYKHGLRSYLYPLLFAALFKILSLFCLDHQILLVFLPKVLQAGFGAIGDFYTYKLAQKLCGQSIALWTLLCQVSSWFLFYTTPRTLINNMEMVLITIGLYYYSWHTISGKKERSWNCEQRSSRAYTFFAILSVVVRPTSAIIWLPLFLWHLSKTNHVFTLLFFIYIPIGSLIFLINLLIDYFCYGHWIIVMFNFFKFNVLSGLSSFYGAHPWYWYWIQGIPVVLGPHLIPFLLGMWTWNDRRIIFLFGWTITVYSCLCHKEFRFILPIMPLAMCCCGVYLNHLCKKGIKEEHSADTKYGRWLLIVLLSTSFPIAAYFSLVHQRGTLDVMKYLSQEASFNKHMNVLFLMPCHSTPFYSHLHQNISMRILTCEPNVNGISNYIDEADIFYKDPYHWLSNEYTNHSYFPTHVVFFDSLYQELKVLLEIHNMRKCADLFHTHVPDGRVGGRVFVYCL